MFYKNDYLTGCKDYVATVCKKDGEIILGNGLAQRRFIIDPDFACVSMINLYSGEQFLRSIKPEITVTVDGVKYPVGGVSGQFEHGFMKASWYNKFGPSEGFNFERYEVTKITRDIVWKKKRQSAVEKYPPDGICLKVYFKSKLPELEGIEICVNHELFDNMPTFGKSFEIVNKSGRDIRLNEFEAEILALTEHDPCNLEVSNVTSQARNIFPLSSIENTLTPTFRYEEDPEYTSQIDFMSHYPIMLVSKPPIGPYKKIKDGETFSSYYAYLMLFDEHDRNRRMLQISEFYKKLAPWTTESPIYVHIISTDFETIARGIDQCVETGFEMVILSFGSGINMEDASDENIAKFKKIADYAHSKGIEIGGYSLLASRYINEESNVIAEKIIFGSSPCLGSEWGIKYMQDIRTFLDKTGFDVLEHDGSYPGDYCRSTDHPGHECYEDSQYTQLMAITDLYAWCKEKGIYLNVPDHYYLSGNNKCAMGYKEVNWSLPREQQVILARQNIHDGTYEKLPTMGWMFVPLTEYHGGGEAATIEPLCEHIDHYRLMLNNNLMAGVQASYRGLRLYDTEETKEMVRSSVETYKKHRAILESPAVHIRRADGRDYDGYVHVNPDLEEKGLAVFFNPLDTEIRRTVKIPLYFTGLDNTAKLALFDKDPQTFTLTRDYCIETEIVIPANDFIWFTVK
ncbi:MAG: alpha-galactosidase [Clostridia bacterium]|nr:alpha-galactosidase [Clostridia bacterium]